MLESVCCTPHLHCISSPNHHLLSTSAVTAIPNRSPCFLSCLLFHPVPAHQTGQLLCCLMFFVLGIKSTSKPVALPYKILHDLTTTFPVSSHATPSPPAHPPPPTGAFFVFQPQWACFCFRIFCSFCSVCLESPSSRWFHALGLPWRAKPEQPHWLVTFSYNPQLWYCYYFLFICKFSLMHLLPERRNLMSFFSVYVYCVGQNHLPHSCSIFVEWVNKWANE